MLVREVTKTATRIGASQMIGVNSVDNRWNGHGMNWTATERVSEATERSVRSRKRCLSHRSDGTMTEYNLRTDRDRVIEKRGR